MCQVIEITHKHTHIFAQYPDDMGKAYPFLAGMAFQDWDF